jgi:SagB-type dehydrogenase family enzyme
MRRSMESHFAIRLDGALAEPREERLFELYHENSKLFPELARDMAAEFSVSPVELHLASRGFKQYRNAPRVALPPPARSRNALSRALRERRSNRELTAPLALGDLATLLVESFEPTSILHNEELGIDQPLRPWPSAGGLYPLDVYVIAANVDGLEPGLYHHNVLTSELERLAGRPPQEILHDGFFYQEFIVSSAAVLLLTAVFDRTIAKYGERGYRLVLLDAGHAAQNVLLDAERLGLPAVAVGGFCDDALAADVGLDGLDEAVVHTVVLGGRHA